MPIDVVATAVKELVKEATIPAMNEVSINALKESVQQSIQEGVKKVSDINMQNATNYAQQYLENKGIREKLSIANRNPEVRGALLNMLDGSGVGNGPESKLKGALNECERFADLKSFADIKKEIPFGNNRIDLLCDSQKPIKFTGLSLNERNGVYLKDFNIRPNQKFAIECKDGDFTKYILKELPHILEQVKAGKELSGGISLLQLTPRNFEALKGLPIDMQKDFFQKITDAGGKVIVCGTDSSTRMQAIMTAMKMVA